MNLRVRRLRQLYRPSDIGRISGDPAHTVERVHPLREVVVVLAVLVPFQTLIGRLVGLTFVQLFSDPQAPSGRVQLTLLLIQAADPAASWIIVAVPTEGMMHLIDQG